MKLFSLGEFLTLEKTQIHLEPRIVTDRDMKVSAGGACYAEVAASHYHSGGDAWPRAAPSLPVASLQGLVLSCAVIGAHEARALHAVFPLEVLWYTTAAGVVLQPHAKSNMRGNGKSMVSGLAVCSELSSSLCVAPGEGIASFRSALWIRD